METVSSVNLNKILKRSRCVLAFLVAGLLAVTSSSAISVEDPACKSFELTSYLVNIRKDPEKTGGYIDMLEKGDIACVTEEKVIGEQRWGFVKQKVKEGGAPTDVGGWANFRYLAAVEAEKTGSETSSDEAQSDEPKESSEPEVETANVEPSSSGENSPDSDQDVLTFTQPVPFGAFPVQGKSLKKLAAGTPLFSPIKGLDEELWKKTCSTCHQWNKERLCAQGKSYVKTARHVLRHQHPYGGPYKVALMRWASAGCK